MIAEFQAGKKEIINSREETMQKEQIDNSWIKGMSSRPVERPRAQAA
jgi:hypothetical protein